MKFWVITLTIATLTILGGWYAIDTRDIKYTVGVIQDKAFSAGTVGTTVTVGTNGQPQFGTTITSDEYYIFVNEENFSVSRSTWLRLDEGDKVRVGYSWLGTESIELLN